MQTLELRLSVRGLELLVQEVLVEQEHKLKDVVRAGFTELLAGKDFHSEIRECVRETVKEAILSGVEEAVKQSMKQHEERIHVMGEDAFEEFVKMMEASNETTD